MASSDIEQKKTSPMLVGIILFIISEASLFGSLFWAYYYLRANTAVWPPQGVELNLTLASINTFFLLSSSGTVWWATRSVRKGMQKSLVFALLATILLGVIFLGITAWEWTHESFRPWTHAYGSIFFTLTGFHALHVFGGVLLLSALLTRALKNRFSAQHFLAVDIGSIYWHYVDFIWIFVFTTIFIIR